MVDIGLGNHLLWIVDTKMTIYKKKNKDKKSDSETVLCEDTPLIEKIFHFIKKIKIKIAKKNTTRSYFLRHLKLD